MTKEKPKVQYVFDNTKTSKAEFARQCAGFALLLYEIYLENKEQFEAEKTKIDVSRFELLKPSSNQSFDDFKK